MQLRLTFFAAASLLTSLLAAPKASACGGLFCSVSAPVVQNAERIVFVDNGDGTMSMMVEILYSGPSENFAWVLPVAGVPAISVGATRALAALDALTRPVFNLNFEGQSCPINVGGVDASVGGFADASVPTDSGVVVEAQGTVGPYDYVIISVDPLLPSPADAGKEWLIDNGYDVSTVGAETLAVYLQGGQNLLAFRLTKNATTGSIRPVIMTYDSNVPVIPIRPTALAAQNDMGVLVFVYGAGRAVPTSYDEIVIPDEAIDWTSPVTSYRSLVSAAVDAADSHAFVLERAASAPSVSVGAASARAILTNLQTSSATDVELVQAAINGLVGEEGFTHALANQSVTFVESVSPSDGGVGGSEVPLSTYLLCTGCYTVQLGSGFARAALLADLEALVVKPLEDTEALLARRPYLTRFFTTLDPSEMTVDPVFTFHASLPDVSNVRSATIVSTCVDGTTYSYTRFSNGRTIPTTTPPSEVPLFLKRTDYSPTGVPTSVTDNSAAVLAATSATPPVVPTARPSGTLAGGRCDVGAGRVSSRNGMLFAAFVAGVAGLAIRRRRAA